MGGPEAGRGAGRGRIGGRTGMRPRERLRIAQRREAIALRGRPPPGGPFPAQIARRPSECRDLCPSPSKRTLHLPPSRPWSAPFLLRPPPPSTLACSPASSCQSCTVHYATPPPSCAHLSLSTVDTPSAPCTSPRSILPLPPERPILRPCSLPVLSRLAVRPLPAPRRPFHMHRLSTSP